MNAAKIINFLRHLKWDGSVRFQQKALSSCCVNGESIGYQITTTKIMYTVVKNSSMGYLNVNAKWIIGLWDFFANNETSFEKLESC